MFGHCVYLYGSLVSYSTKQLKVVAFSSYVQTLESLVVAVPSHVGSPITTTSPPEGSMLDLLGLPGFMQM